MKVADNRPAVVKSVVRITDEQYEIYYAKPQCLGKINKRGGYWYTIDGMRFVSSRDAMEYLIRLGEVAMTQRLPAPAVTKVTNVPETTRKKIAEKIRDSKQEKKGLLDLHQEFQRFLAWREKKSNEPEGNGSEKKTEAPTSV